MDDYSSIVLKSEDVLLLLSKLQNIGWPAVREASINRILYLSAVLYSFRYPDNLNIFDKDYQFSRTLSGPEDVVIEKALIHLTNNELITHTDEGYSCGSIVHTISLNENYKIKESNIGYIFTCFITSLSSVIYSKYLLNSSNIPVSLAKKYTSSISS